MTSGVLRGARRVGEPKICNTHQRSNASGLWKQDFHAKLGSPWTMPPTLTHSANEMLSKVGPAAAYLPGDAARLALHKVLLHQFQLGTYLHTTGRPASSRSVDLATQSRSSLASCVGHARSALIWRCAAQPCPLPARLPARAHGTKASAAYTWAHRAPPTNLLPAWVPQCFIVLCSQVRQPRDAVPLVCSRGVPESKGSVDQMRKRTYLFHAI
jgi:hypothetical protein